MEYIPTLENDRQEESIVSFRTIVQAMQNEQALEQSIGKQMPQSENSQQNCIHENSQQNKQAIDTEENCIVIPIQKQQQPDKIVKNSPMKNIEKQCRICLEDQSEGKLLRPCLCSGSINHVHEKCLKQWILRKINITIKNKVKCQVCDFQYQYKLNKSRSLSYEQFKKNGQEYVGTYRCYFFVLFLSICVILGLSISIIISATDSVAGQSIRKVMITSDNIRIVYVCVTFVYFNIIMFASLLFVIQYAVITEYSIGQVLDIAQYAKKTKVKIHPKIKNSKN